MQNSLTNTFLKGMNLDTAKEFISSDLYIDALDVHVNTDAGATAGALQPYLDVIVDGDNNTLANHTVLGTTAGHFGKDKTSCFIVLSYYQKVDGEGKAEDRNALSVFDIKTNTPLWKLETSDLQCKTRAKLVNLWEDEKRSRVYISSEDSYILVVNINSNYGTVSGVVNIVDGYDFSIFPRCGALSPFKFNEIVAGSKTAGKVQYAYQLFNKDGKTTALSAISHTIPIGSEMLDTLTKEGISIRLDNVPSEYEFLRIFEINYTNSSDLPRIYIKDEIKIHDKHIIYNDISDDRLSEYTLEQFQAIKNASFKASTVEIKDNRLFAANVTDAVWDIDFDARVYSADSSGMVKYIDEVGLWHSVPLEKICSGEHKVDDRVVYNNPDPDTYRYNTLYGFTTNKETPINGDLHYDTVLKFSGFLSEILSFEEFNDYGYQLIECNSTIDNVLVNVSVDSEIYEITETELNGVRIIEFPVNDFYYADNIKIYNGVFVENFWCCVDQRNKIIYKTCAYQSKQTTCVDINNNTDIVWYHEGVGYYKITLLEAVDFNKYALVKVSADSVSFDKYPKGGAGINVQYMFVRPLLHLAPNVKNKNVFDNGIGLLSRDTTQNRYEDGVDKIKILLDIPEKDGWLISEDHVKDQNCQHTIKDVTYKDPYICANYTGFKQGEYYTFGIIFYNNSGMPSPVHNIGTIHIPYFENWIFGSVADGGRHHDLLATTVGIRFKVNFDTLDKTTLSEISAYEIVRVLKKPDTRKVLMQGFVSRTLNYPQEVSYGGASLGDSDLRSPIYPTISENFFNLYRYDMSGGNYVDLRKISVVNLNNNYITLTSPEISTNKENIQQTLKYVSKLRSVQKLSSIVCDTNFDLTESEAFSKPIIEGNPLYQIDHIFPVYKYVSYMTVPGTEYTLGEKVYKHYGVSGVPVFYVYENYTLFENLSYKGISSSFGWPEVGYGIFKYYLPSKDNTGCVDVDEILFCGTLPANALGDSSITNSTAIQDKLFVNVTEFAGLFDFNGNPGMSYHNSRIGLHSNCVIMKVSGNVDKFIDVTGTVTNYDSNGLPIYDGIKCNWSINDNLTKYKQFDISDLTYAYPESLNIGLTSIYPDISSELVNVGGTTRCMVKLVDVCTNNVELVTYSTLPKLSYTSTGQYKLVESGKTVSYIDCFGGDTYVCIHKELWTGFGYDLTYTDDALKAKDCINVKYPVETRVNLDRVSGPNCDTTQPNVMLTFEPGQLLQYGSQSKPLNEYNDAYSAQEYNKVFVSKGVWDLNNQHLSNRILASEVKSLGELTDSFQDFKIANYIDVDGQYGPITNLVKYNGRLYYLQSTAFGTVSINERSLITDNNQATLLLGTGDVLQRCDYISTFNGSNKLNDPSIVVSPSSLYWYDSNKQSIQVFNQGGLNSLSKLKNVQSYFDNIVRDKTVHSGYDMKYNEVWFSAEDSGRDSIIYSEQIQAFVGFYSKQLRYPKTGERFALGLTPDNKFIHFGECYGHVNPELSLRHVEFVVNQNAGMPKVFDTFAVNDCVRPMKDEAQWFVAKFSTNRQGDASLTPPVNKEGVYYMPIGRDSNKERMRDKIMTVKLTLNTTEFSIPSVSTMFRYSRI